MIRSCGGGDRPRARIRGTATGDRSPLEPAADGFVEGRPTLPSPNQKVPGATYSADS